MAGGCGAEPRTSQYGGAAPGGVGTVRTAHGTGRCGPHTIQGNPRGTPAHGHDTEH